MLSLVQKRAEGHEADGLLSAGRFLPADEDLGRCALKLQESTLFTIHADYIRRQFVQCLIEVCGPTSRYFHFLA